MRGLGKIYKRGSVWWIRYSYRGRDYRESSRSESEAQARRLLRKRLGEIGRGKLLGPNEERVTFDDLAKALLLDYQVNGRRSIRSAELSIRHLGQSLGLHRAVDITSERIKAHIFRRQLAGAANASINRELSCLKRMFSLAVKSGRLANVPYIPMLEENNARQRFLDHGSFLALRDALPEYLKDAIAFLYLSGWRLGEMRTLEWRDVDLDGNVIRLRSENSKNKTPRTLPLSGELREIIDRARQNRRLDCRFVFHREDRPIGDFRHSWDKARRATGLDGVITHDMRRTAVRNMVRAGIPERVAMVLSGHKTRSIFDRYNIVNEADLVEAAHRLQTHLETQRIAPKTVLLNH